MPFDQEPDDEWDDGWGEGGQPYTELAIIFSEFSEGDAQSLEGFDETLNELNRVFASNCHPGKPDT